MKDLTIYKANKFIEASYAMTLDEMRILSLTLGNFNVQEPRKIFDFTVQEFIDAFPDVDSKSAYLQCNNAINKLKTRWMTLADNANEFTEVSFLTKRTYFKKEGRFTIVISEDLIPYICHFKESGEEYTSYYLKAIELFKSIHAIRLYELLIQYKNTRIKQRKITILNFKKWLFLENKYPEYRDLNKRVIKPSLQEINEKSDLNVTYETIKQGRKIIALNFKITLKRKKSLTNNLPKTKLGRPKLSQRPQVKKGSNEEGIYYQNCIKLIKDHWGSVGLKLHQYPQSELKLLRNFYSKIGDTFAVKDIDNILLNIIS